MFDFGTKDLVIIAVIVVFLFGATKIPQLTKGLVDSMRHLRNAFKDEPTQPQPPVDTKKS